MSPKPGGSPDGRNSSNGGAGDGVRVMDRARQTVDEAIGLIRREVQNQREKSNSMCKLKTAHNWEEVKTAAQLDEEAEDGNSYFMRAHTITVLVFLIGCLVYVALFEDTSGKDVPPKDGITSYNTKRGLIASLSFWGALGMTIMPDGPFSRPHPSIWRFVFSISIAYELLLIFMLFQTPDDARKLLKHLDKNLGEPIKQKDYGGNCRIYDPDVPHDPFHNLKDKVDVFMLAHAGGYWCKTLIFRDWWFTTVISVMFEFLEYSLEHQLPNFSECWWDHWILDVVVCNGLGTILGLYTLRYLSMKTYDWRGLWNIPTYRGKMKRIFAQFSPHGWIKFTWNPLSSLERWLAVVAIIFIFLLAELNTFYLKFVLWVEPEHWLNFVRLGFFLFWGAVGMRETFQLLDDPECDRLGRQTWVVLAIVATELLLCIKFGWSTISKPLHKGIVMWWLAGLTILIAYTIVKFVIFKPTKLGMPKTDTEANNESNSCKACSHPKRENKKDK